MRVRVHKGFTGLLPFASTIIPWEAPVTYVLRPMKDKARPRTTIPAPTLPQLAAFREQMAAHLAQQRIAKGIGTDYSLAYPAALAEVEALVQDTNDYSTPHAKPTARRAKPKKPKSPPVKWLEQAAEVVTARRIEAGENVDPHESYQTVLNELKDGYFNPAYWVQCDIVATDYLSNVPTTSEDTEDRSYAYPDPTNTRTLATYGLGEPAEGPPRYSGNTLLGEFRDSLLVWQRTVFELENEFTHDQIEPTFIDASGTITAFADQRGSRPMLSWLMKTWNVTEDSTIRETTLSPTYKPWSWYYRYKLPQALDPYYGATEIKRAVRTMRQPAHEEHEGTLTHSVVIHSPRPMYGRGFNNNTAVTTQIDLDLKIWQIKINEDDTPPEHLYMWTLSGHMDIQQEFDFSNFPLYVRYTMGFEPTNLGTAEIWLGMGSWCPVDLIDAFTAAFNAGCTAVPTFHTMTGDSGVYENGIVVSDWQDGGVDGQSAFMHGHHWNTTGGFYYGGFIWSTTTNAITLLTSADFYSDTDGGLLLTYDTIDSMRTDTNALYVNGFLREP